MRSTEHPSEVIDGLLRHYGVALLEYQGNGAFATRGGMPNWFEGVFGTPEGTVVPSDVSLFLASFLQEAEAHWNDGDGRLNSGAFTEAGSDGRERTLEATAVRIADYKLLLISPPNMRLDDVQQLLQAARDEHLARERERKEVEQREVLLHCIVHDLSNPLSGLKGSLQLLNEDDLVDEDGQELLGIATRQVERMQKQIRAVLDAFKAEVAKQLPTSGEGDPPDVSACPKAVIESLEAAAKLAGLTIESDLPDHAMPIVGDKAKFQRVLFNLIGNALRYAPRGTAIRVTAKADGDDVEIAVEDEGPGVPDERIDTLFKRFGKGPDGQTGLGLYFCRITAEHWGGSVGYAHRDGGGARFWIRLPRRS